MNLPGMANLKKAQKPLTNVRSAVIDEWVNQELCKAILKRHEIDTDFFIEYYAQNVFDYFMGVVAGTVMIGECPVVAELIDYLKDKELRADELFTLCTHFKRSMLNATYRLGINEEEIFASISYLFDQNFAAVLKLYTDTIYQKEQEALNASKAKEYFLSNMSHEIRTPLNAILGFVSLLRDETTTLRHRKYLDIISNSGENLLHIINDILDFSKLRSGEFTVDPQPFNIHDEISHTMELFVPSANSKNITLTSFIDPSIPYEMTADALRIKQILGNFLSNAVKFSDHGGAIHVEAKYEEGMLNLSVRDQGKGIAPADQARIFDAFSQAQEGMTRMPGGTGLGLSICKQLAEHMGGTIELESALGEGSLFSLKIPVAINDTCGVSKFDISMFEGMRFGLLRYDPSERYKLESLQRYWEYFGLEIQECDSLDEEVDLLIFLESSMDDEKRNKIINEGIPSVAILDFLDDRYDNVGNIAPLTFPIYCTKLQGALGEVMGQDPTHPILSPGNGGRNGFAGKVLVAEDNDANQELIKIVLERYGLEYVVVSNGREAVDRYRCEAFDIVLMDEQMPVMNGHVATAEILAYERRSGREHAPIIAVTANVIKASRECSAQNGYDAFLGKPLVLKEIEQVFERYLPAVALAAETPAVSAESAEPAAVGVLDMERLKSALMLNEEQITHLLSIYRKKMEKSLLELSDAIERTDYETIAAIGHSMKGSSANFRFEDLSRLARVIEESAVGREDEFDFREAHEVFTRELRKLFG